MASLKKLVAKMTQVAFDAIGDLKDEVNYVQFATGDYDTETSQPTYTYNVQTGIGALLTTFSEDEKDATILVLKDRKMLIPTASFNLTLTDATDDTIVDQDGKEWDVIKYRGITGGSLHVFQVRMA